MAKGYLAFDLGAESGRLMAGRIERGKLALEEIHRFPNTPERVNGSLHWNIGKLLGEVRTGLTKAAGLGRVFESISTDSWGVDYVLFDERGTMMPPVYHYRDPRTKMGVERLRARVGREAVFDETGIQFMPINTLYQLCAEDPARLRSAAFLLGIGDAVNHVLAGGKPRMEVSMASTFQLYNPRAKRWSESLIREAGLPANVFPEIVKSGTRLGPLLAEYGIPGLEVIATCSHDTGAAVAGVPADEGSWAFLSSGTWSLLGVELAGPVIDERARELNFTNEIGYGDSVRFLKNLSGLWLVQECRRAWARSGREYDYATLTREAAAAPAFRSLINPMSEEFLAPANMPAQISEFCRRTGQSTPESAGELVRCALESLALLYRRTLREVELLTGRAVERLHVVGGGSNNELLNQFTADSLQIPVFAGPTEATAAGNILIQAIAMGDLGSLAEGREVVRASTELRRFEPRETRAWDEAAKRFEQISA